MSCVRSGLNWELSKMKLNLFSNRKFLHLFPPTFLPQFSSKLQSTSHKRSLQNLIITDHILIKFPVLSYGAFSWRSWGNFLAPFLRLEGVHSLSIEQHSNIERHKRVLRYQCRMLEELSCLVVSRRVFMALKQYI